MAVNCCVVPSAMLGVGGVTIIDANVGGVTVKVTDAEVIAPNVAVIPLVPAATGEATPLEPTALLIVAIELVAEVQVTEAVRS